MGRTPKAPHQGQSIEVSLYSYLIVLLEETNKKVQLFLSEFNLADLKSEKKRVVGYLVQRDPHGDTSHLAKVELLLLHKVVG